MTMRLDLVFATIPWWFIAVGVIVSIYHGYRGYVLQCAFAEHQQSQLGPTFKLSRRDTIVTRCAYDGFFYFFCSITGFAALWFATYIVNALPTIQDISGGTSAFLVFLILLGLLGVSGQLSTLIQLGKLPK